MRQLAPGLSRFTSNTPQAVDGKTYTRRNRLRIPMWLFYFGTLFGGFTWL